MKLLLSAGKVIDPVNKINEVLDILIEDGKIIKVAKDIKDKTAKVMELKGLIVVPGLIDMHVHLREPGFEYKETIETGVRSAVMGGFTSVACMANNEPVMDNTAVVELVISKGKKENLANVYPIASVSKHAKGEEISDIGMLINSGAVALSDDAAPLMNAEVMRRAFEYTKQFNVSIITHCEDKNMTMDGVMNESFNSTILGMRGMPTVAESLMVYRNIAIANYMGALVHIAHVSCKESVEIIRWAKKQGMKVTCETAPHYFTLTDDAVKTYDTNTKMNPPLRGTEDVKAIKAGLKDGTIDCIASDHAPHGRIDKELEYNYASFGIVGLETMLPLVLTELVDKKIITLEQAVEKLSVMPAKVLGLNKGSLSAGADADITVLDIEKKYTVDINKFQSKSKNSPFNGRASKVYSNFRAEESLGDYLKRNKIIGLECIDTRKLVRHIRTHGSKKGVLLTIDLDIKRLVKKAKVSPSIVGVDLVKRVTCSKPYKWTEEPYFVDKDSANSKVDQLKLFEVDHRKKIYNVVAIDCGIKFNILRDLVYHGCNVTVVPAKTTAGQIMAYNPDGVFLSNGPGDPEAVTYVVETVKNLLGKLPIFGICLGHQMLGLALGGKTYKMKFGHRGGNQPVMRLENQKVEITPQNHGFAVDMSSIKDKQVLQTHINLNDKTSEGLEHKKYNLFSVQYHPEASPGPHDASYLFDKFIKSMKMNY